MTGYEVGIETLVPMEPVAGLRQPHGPWACAGGAARKSQTATRTNEVMADRIQLMSLFMTVRWIVWFTAEALASRRLLLS